MDILSVINPLSPCTEGRYLLGVFSDNEGSRVLSEILKLIKWFGH